MPRGPEDGVLYRVVALMASLIPALNRLASAMVGVSSSDPTHSAMLFPYVWREPAADDSGNPLTADRRFRAALFPVWLARSFITTRLSPATTSRMRLSSNVQLRIPTTVFAGAAK